MHKFVIAAASCTALLACSGSPPKPPTVDGTNRTAINDSETAALLAVRAELAQIKELLRKAEAEQAKQQAATSAPAVVRQAPPPAAKSHTFTVRFPYNSASFQPTPSQEAELLPLLANAQRIEARGRTDADRPSAGDERIALWRAQAAQTYLIAHGAASEKVSINYLSGGDHVASNATAAGRAQNRRVEIEIFNH